MKPPLKPTALFFAALAVVCLLFGGCKANEAKTPHHTAAISAPSVDPVKERIAAASKASEETSRQISSIRKGTDKVDYKASRALRFFP